MLFLLIALFSLTFSVSNDFEKDPSNANINARLSVFGEDEKDNLGDLTTDDNEFDDETPPINQEVKETAAELQKKKDAQKKKELEKQKEEEAKKKKELVKKEEDAKKKKELEKQKEDAKKKKELEKQKEEQKKKDLAKQKEEQKKKDLTKKKFKDDVEEIEPRKQLAAYVKDEEASIKEDGTKVSTLDFDNNNPPITQEVKETAAELQKKKDAQKKKELTKKEEAAKKNNSTKKPQEQKKKALPKKDQEEQKKKELVKKQEEQKKKELIKKQEAQKKKDSTKKKFKDDAEEVEPQKQLAAYVRDEEASIKEDGTKVSTFDFGNELDLVPGEAGETKNLKSPGMSHKFKDAIVGMKSHIASIFG